MIDPEEAAREFDAAFEADAPEEVTVRPEREDDEPFLRELFLASYALRNVLPAPMVDQQVTIRLAAFRSSFPNAMRRIALGQDGPIGRIIIDWRHPHGSHCADVAVRPEQGGRGVGSAMLRAWITVADRHAVPCSLQVAPENPARALYMRLGFAEVASDTAAIAISMVRPTPSSAAAT